LNEISWCIKKINSLIKCEQKIIIILYNNKITAFCFALKKNKYIAINIPIEKKYNLSSSKFIEIKILNKVK
jgi:hypothetical protein